MGVADLSGWVRAAVPAASRPDPVDQRGDRLVEAVAGQRWAVDSALRLSERSSDRPGQPRPRAQGTVVSMLLLVDAANVVGSRPDGWWRDRAGAATGLVERLAAVPGAQVAGARVDGVVVVLEGQAQVGYAPTGAGPVRVVHAAGSGDDTLAALCAPGVVLVTADRELQGRARSAGADVVTPSRLLEVLDSLSAGP